MAETTITKATLAKVAKLLEVAKELHGKQGDILEEVDNLLGGKVSIGEKLKLLEGAFDAAWCSRYAPGATGRYVWNYAQDRANSKRLLKQLAVEDMGARALRYIRSDDPFFVKARHPFSLFVRSIVQWAEESEAPEGFDLEGPTDCRHTPRCKDDAAHTKRKQQELRASA